MTGSLTPGGYLRHPTLHGDTLVFVYEDELWRMTTPAGQAARLTAGVCEADRPRLSPDGRHVAFVGADDGPAEVYVMPLAGGPARRLTHQAAARCAVVGWHPHTGEIVYASTAEQPSGFGFRLFAVPATGGRPRLFDHGPANALAFGPDGGTVLGRANAEPARWKRYRGGAAGQLWIDPTGSGKFHELLELPGNLGSPCWVGDRVHFISDHEGVGNVYSCATDGTGLDRHTDHRDFYARNLTTDGRRLAYHAGGALHLLDPATGRHEPLDVRLTPSGTQHARRFVAAADSLESARLSPDGTRTALVARGKVTTFAHWSGPAYPCGTPDGVRYSHAAWLADGRRLVAVAADERPDERLVVLTAGGTTDGPGVGPAEIELPVQGAGLITEVVPAPTGGLVAFANNRQQLWITGTDTDAPELEARLIDTSLHERIEDLTWSPDGRWLAYTYPDTPRTTAIRIAEVATGRTHPVTTPVLRDYMPTFDPGGRYLYFIGQRDLRPEYDQVKFDVGFPFGARPYLVSLRADDLPAFVPGHEPHGQPSTRAEHVTVDLDGIQYRAVPLPVREGRYVSVTGLHDKVLLLSVPVAAPDTDAPGTAPDGTITHVDLTTGEVTEEYLGPVDDITAAPDAGMLLYHSGNRLRVLDAATAQETAAEHDGPHEPPGRQSGWIDIDRIKIALTPAAEWHQMYREAWRLQRENFWNAEMDGVDWQAVYDRYLPLVSRVATRAELSDLLWEMQGELATSHAYEQGGDYLRPEHHAQGFLGVDWDDDTVPAQDADPGWRIRRILHGDPWNRDATSPCGRPGLGIRAGDLVTAINGRPVGPAGPGEHLVGQAGAEVELTLLRAAEPPRRVVVRAIADEGGARYRDWAEHNRAYVRTASQGRLGYIHVPEMNCTGYTEFIRAFIAESDREGLVVDVRFNSGGHVSPLILDRLARPRSGVEHGRWSGGAPYPPESPRGTTVALVNEQTGSDGEIFSHLFRARGLGQLIGNRTWGGVIATWPRHPLVDGTITTQPEFRFYFNEVGDRLENHGVTPDIEVVYPPQSATTDEDPQLASAVDYLLQSLDRRTDGPRP
ncbi:S41 family peptidase [Streptomyces sp. TBY4]|uniref:S41 family peptidase n=1 Tax=Streptomyces sp. TBY4 TaxID=2962030 RepID=UPI0020B8E0CD|nr:S41 family peptidase [Streptomyces sp. TBY4]MCP3760528.1 S41 family peptidase [Streptomyces sp. TBY4]